MGVISQFPIDIGKTHWKALERIFRYLKGTSMLGLPYDGKRNANLVGFAHVDWVGDFDNRRSTSGHCFTLVGVVSWSSKRQTSTTLSSTEAKYMSLTQVAKEALWLRKLLGDLGYHQLVATPMYCNNQSAIALSQNPKYHTRTKHIEVQHHYI
jgi:hypothetical protein